MGGAQAFCSQKRVKAERMSLYCPAGMMFIGKRDKLGIISSKSVNSKYCTEEALIKGEHHFNGNLLENCTAGLNKTLLHQRLHDNCHSKRSCEIDISGLHKDYLDENKECGPDSFIFLQLQCEVHRKNVTGRKILGLGIGCLTVFFYLYTVVYLDYIKTT